MQNQTMVNIRREESFLLILLFVIAAGIRLVPEIIAYPYPIGYDVINYYLPVLSNYENYWPVVSSQFPLYVILLHEIIIGTDYSPYVVVPLAAIIIYGFFSISVYTVSRYIFRLERDGSFFLSLFVIFQTALLRTAWDLHKDMLALTTMLFAISLGLSGRNLSKSPFFVVITLCIFSVLTDRMIGLLLTATLITYALLRKGKKELVLSGIISLVYAVAILNGIHEIEINIQNVASGETKNVSYKQLNLIILFVVTNGLLIPFGIIGFIRSPKTILKIPLLLSLVGSLSWIIYPSNSSLLPDRWTFIFSIFLAIFAAYGIVVLIKKQPAYKFKNHRLYFLVVLAPFMIAGMLFATTSANAAVSLFSAFHDYVGQFGPISMQANSISIEESKSIVSAIDWMNHRTPLSSVIVIDKHWRGWTELELENRSFLFYEGLDKLEAQRKGFYLLSLAKTSIPQFEDARVLLVYKNNNFLLHKVSFDN
jgi:hypothetical protein